MILAIGFGAGLVLSLVLFLWPMLARFRRMRSAAAIENTRLAKLNQTLESEIQALAVQPARDREAFESQIARLRADLGVVTADLAAEQRRANQLDAKLRSLRSALLDELDGPAPARREKKTAAEEPLDLEPHQIIEEAGPRRPKGDHYAAIARAARALMAEAETGEPPPETAKAGEQQAGPSTPTEINDTPTQAAARPPAEEKNPKAALAEVEQVLKRLQTLDDPA